MGGSPGGTSGPPLVPWTPIKMVLMLFKSRINYILSFIISSVFDFSKGQNTIFTKSAQKWSSFRKKYIKFFHFQGQGGSRPKVEISTLFFSEPFPQQSFSMKYSIFSKKAAIVEFSHLTFRKFQNLIRNNPLKTLLAVNFSLKLLCREA